MLRQCRTENILVEVTKFKFFSVLSVVIILWESRVETLGFIGCQFSVYMTQTCSLLGNTNSAQPADLQTPYSFLMLASKYYSVLFAYFSHILISKKQKALRRKSFCLRMKVSLSKIQFKNWRDGIGTYSNLLLAFKFHILAIS